jgi:hypothetical protein
MVGDISPDEARAALDRAAESTRRLRAKAWSMRAFSLVNAAAWAASILAFGFIRPIPLRLLVWLALLVLPLIGVVSWYRRLPVTAVNPPPPRYGWQSHVWTMIAVYTIAVIVGQAADLYGQPWYWVPAALAVAAPLTVLALRLPRV